MQRFSAILTALTALLLAAGTSACGGTNPVGPETITSGSPASGSESQPAGGNSADDGTVADDHGANSGNDGPTDVNPGTGTGSGGSSGSDGSGTASGSGPEVHGIVAAVDSRARIVTLQDGRAVAIPSDALIDATGDFRTLSDVEAAIGRGLEVRVEADLRASGGANPEVTSAKFETDDPGANPTDPNDDAGIDEIHGFVASVDLAARTILTTDGGVLRIVSDALIDAKGDILTLAGVQAAVQQGVIVRVEADGGLENGAFVASLAKFEVD